MLQLPLKKTIENLETIKLKFRKLEAGDVETLLPFFSSAEAMKFLFPLETPVKTAESWLEKQFGRYAENNGLYALIHKDTNEFIGQCGLLVQDVDDKQELEIGYHLLPAHWGNGYATEAAIACKKFAFENEMADSIISIIHVDNIASQKVALRNGMQAEKHTTFKGLPVIIYRISSRQFFSGV